MTSSTGGSPVSGTLPARVMEACPLPAFLKDRRLRYVAANDAFVEFLGGSMERYTRQGAAGVPHEPNDVEMNRHDAELLARPGRFNWSATLRHHDGSLRDVDIAKTSVVSEDGSSFWILGFLTDVTGRNILVERLQMLRSAVDQMSDAFLISDTENRIVYTNPAFERLTGYTAGDVVGHNPRILKSSRQHPWFYEDMWRALSAGRPWHGRLVNRRKNGSEYLEDMAISPLREPFGKPLGYVAVKRDAGEETASEARRLSLERKTLLGHISTEIAHDFKNILAAVVGNAQLCLVRGTVAGKDIEQIEKIEAAGKTGVELTHRLLAFARGDEPTKQPTAVELSVLLRGAAALVRALLPSTIVLRLDEDLPSSRVCVDRVEFQQIFLNLASNTRDALGFRPGIVTVGASPVTTSNDPPGEVEVRFADSGPGIPPEVQARIFDASVTTGDRTEHFGLGLTTVRRLCERTGGSVRVESAPGAGTTFILRFPICLP